MKIVKLTYGCSNRRLRLLIFFIVVIGAGVFTSSNSVHACNRLASTEAWLITGPHPCFKIEIRVEEGDTLSGISTRYGVPVSRIMTDNNLAVPDIQAGQTLYLTREAQVETLSARRLPRYDTYGTLEDQVGTFSARHLPRYLKRKPQEETLSARHLPWLIADFHWPIQGPITSNFGPQLSGKHNEGINIKAAPGTAVKAAKDGVVIYAGNGLETYGNLILIRHDANWVSAYAHNSRIIVKRDDQVRRGQIIAKAGMTGSTSEPQVHFELRYGSKPVDPLQHLVKRR